MKIIYNYSFKICNLFVSIPKADNTSKVGITLAIAEEEGAICRIFFSAEKKYDEFEEKESSLIKEAAKQLDEYFNRKRKEFDLPVIPHGTEFQKKSGKSFRKFPTAKRAVTVKLPRLQEIQKQAEPSVWQITAIQYR